MIDYLLNRLREPSTYAGLAGIALALGLSADEWHTISSFAAAAAGLAAMILSERHAAARQADAPADQAGA